MPRGKSNDGTPNRGWFKAGDPKLKVKSASHRAAMSEGMRRAWQTKRQRMPVGSKYTDVHGYIRIKVVPGKGRWRLEHVVVMEKKIGRPLRDGEIVHHIDGARANNEPQNLYLCRDHAHHMEIEKQLKEAFRELLRRDVVSFNHLLGVYSCQ